MIGWIRNYFIRKRVEKLARDMCKLMDHSWNSAVVYNIAPFKQSPHFRRYCERCPAVQISTDASYWVNYLNC